MRLGLLLVFTCGLCFGQEAGDKKTVKIEVM